MLLLLMQVRPHNNDNPRGVSVWVDDANPERAEQRATAALAAAGWQHIRTDAIAETAAADYFRVCPSQQAFARAQTEGIAWRFDDDPAECQIS